MWTNKKISKVIFARFRESPSAHALTRVVDFLFSVIFLRFGVANSVRSIVVGFFGFDHDSGWRCR